MSTCKTGKVGFFKNLSSTYSKFQVNVKKEEIDDQSLDRSKLASSNTAKRSDVGSMNKSASNMRFSDVSGLIQTKLKLGKNIKSFFKDKIMDKINSVYNENE